MFNLLSSEKKCQKIMSSFTQKQLAIACSNLKLIIELLNTNTTDLLANRRDYGVLLPQGYTKKRSMSLEKLPAPTNEQLFMEQEYLIHAINALCLTEAILIRNNFSNCLADILEEDEQIPPNKQNITLNNSTAQSPETNVVTEKSNVSPIRLTEIKQRLAQAAQSSTDKKDEVKNRLNKLLDKPPSTISKKYIRQA